MKKIFPLILIAIIAITAGSCRRASHNGLIDGMWRIDEITVTATGENVDPLDKFICVNLELMQLGHPTPEITGILHYHKGDERFSVEFPYRPSDDKMAGYGFAYNSPDTDVVTLDVELLNHKHMVLRSPIATITCTRY